MFDFKTDMSSGLNKCITFNKDVPLSSAWYVKHDTRGSSGSTKND